MRSSKPQELAAKIAQASGGIFEEDEFDEEDEGDETRTTTTRTKMRTNRGAAGRGSASIGGRARWPGLRYSEAPVQRPETGGLERLDPGTLENKNDLELHTSPRLNILEPSIMATRTIPCPRRSQPPQRASRVKSRSRTSSPGGAWRQAACAGRQAA